MNQSELEGLQNVLTVRGDMFSRAWHRYQPRENVQSAPSAGKQTTGGKREKKKPPVPSAGKYAAGANGAKRGKICSRWKAREEKAAGAKRGKICIRCKWCQARVNTLKNPDWCKSSEFVFIVCYWCVVGYCSVNFFTLLTQKL